MPFITFVGLSYSNYANQHSHVARRDTAFNFDFKIEHGKVGKVDVGEWKKYWNIHVYRSDFDLIRTVQEIAGNGRKRTTFSEEGIFV